MNLFLDCDGVLANFDKFVIDLVGLHPRQYEKEVGAKAFWKLMHEKKVFANLEPMKDAKHLVDSVRHLNPTILTGTPWGDWAQTQKLEWRDKHFPGIPLICCPSKDKYKYCQPGDVLIDDWQKYRHLWIRAKGMFISHYCAETSLLALEAYLDAVS